MKSRMTIAAVMALAAAAPAADHFNLEAGFPTRVEDAYVTDYRAVELRATFGYQKLDADADDRFTLQPAVEWGFAPNAQVQFAAPFYLGEADDAGSGDLHIDGLYNFNTESLELPAFALGGEIVVPTGEDSQGVDATVRGILTRTIGDEHLERIHLNLAWSHKFNRDDDERRDRYEAILGYSRRLDADTVLVADLVRSHELEEDQEWNLLELGVRRQLDPLLVISAGVGIGIGDESPDLVITVGLQRSF